MKQVKKTIINLLSSHLLFFFLTTGTILTLNLTPLIMQFKHAPQTHVFSLIHNNTQDFYFYQSLMNQGADGAWLTSDPFTAEPHQPSIIFAYFLWIGKLSKLFGLSFAFSYHIIRVMFGFFLFASSYALILRLSLPFPRLTYLFFLFAAPMLRQTIDGGKQIILPYMNWWTGMDPIRRAAYLPHHMIGGFLLVISVLLILDCLKQQSVKRTLILTLLLITMAFVHTPSLFVILLFLPPVGLFFLLNQKQKKRKLTNLLIYWCIGVFSLLLMLSQTNRGFPWSQYLAWEKTLQFPLLSELPAALGILLPLACLGMLHALFSKRISYLLIASWFITPLLLIPFASWLNISNIRLVQGVPYLPLSILAGLGVKTIADVSMFALAIMKQKRIKPEQSFLLALSIAAQRFKKTSGTYAFIPFLSLLLFTFFTFPSLLWGLKDQIREYWPIYSNVYLDKRLFDAFTFINAVFPSKTKTISTFYTGNYLPAFTHTVSFSGHTGYTYNLNEKEQLVGKFFKNDMKEEEAKELLLNSGITLVFQGPEEKQIEKDYLYPTLLKPVYEKEEVTIYKTR